MRPTLLTALTSLATAALATTIPAAWTTNFNPSTTLTASYLSVPFPPDTLLPLTSLSSAPAVSVTGLSPTIHSIILALIDPDASPPQLHWLHSGYHPANDSATLTSRTPVAEAPYFAPAPPPGEAHRYVLLAFEEGPKGTILTGVPEEGERGRPFEVEEWMKENKLQPAFAGTWFVAQNKVPGTTPTAVDAPVGTATASVSGGPSGTVGGNVTSPTGTLPPQFTEVGSAGARAAAGVGMMGMVALLGAAVVVL
ncbi:phosphatidylethanolamine-binding protein [Geopyxis carbonaria]|nr:phosphatidylethanolamine-binding protein [Geopyxis carbonaria]